MHDGKQREFAYRHCRTAFASGNNARFVAAADANPVTRNGMVSSGWRGEPEFGVAGLQPCDVDGQPRRRFEGAGGAENADIVETLADDLQADW